MLSFWGRNYRDPQGWRVRECWKDEAQIVGGINFEIINRIAVIDYDYYRDWKKEFNYA